MELLIAGSLAGLGYYMSNEAEDTPPKPTQRGYPKEKYQEPDPLPSNKNIYHSNRLTDVASQRQALVKKHQKRMAEKPEIMERENHQPQIPLRPTHTRLNNQRSCQSRDDFSRLTIDQNIDLGSVPQSLHDSSDTFVSPLSGLPMKQSDFTHNNMVPFFGGSIKQNTNCQVNQPLLETFTGVQNHSIKKEEIEPMFKPTRDMSHVHGTPSNISGQVDRYVPSQKRTSEAPVEKVMVGPGLNKGYTWKPSGGFHQSDAREFALPKNVDQLRTITNPKVTYEGRVLSGKSKVDKRGCLGTVEKRAPDRFYKNSPKRYNTTVGAYTKEKVRSHTYVKPTARQTSKQVIGDAGPTTGSREPTRPEIKASKKVVYAQDSGRNLGASGKWNNTKVGDYGKQGHWAPPNERDTTTTRTHTSNLVSVVKALVAPVTDMIRETRKQFTSDVENFGQIEATHHKQTVYDPNDKAKTTLKETLIHESRQGTVGIQAPPKATVYDSNDVARTTIRETNIHNNRTGVLKGPERLTLYDPNEIAKTTIKETNIHNTRKGQISAPTRQTVYDPNDITRTTIKETNIHNTREGQLAAPTRQTVYDPNDVTRTTIKETNIHNTRDGQLSVPTRQTVYDPNDVTRTTLKETNIHNTREGQVSVPTRQTVYDPNDVTRTTLKETNIHNTREGQLSVPTRQTVYDPNDVTRTTVKETNIHNTREGQLAAPTRQTVYDPNDVTRTTVKETNIHNTREGQLAAPTRQTVYDPNDVTRTTLKETNIHDNREGQLSGPTRQTVYDPNDVTRTTIKETNIHDNREGQLSGPTRQTVYDPNDVARTTIKETNIHDNREGQLSGPTRQTVYDPNDVTRTTIKETNIHDTREGAIKGPEQPLAYDPEEIPKTTVRETLPHVDNSHNVKGQVAHQVIDPDDRAKTTVKETTSHNNHHGHIGSVQKNDGYRVKRMEAKTTARELVSDYSYSGHFDGSTLGGGGDGYQVAEVEAPETQRQLTSDYEYSGTAKSSHNAPISYESIMNATMNELREETLRGRDPTRSGKKVSTGKENVNMEIKKMEGDIVNQRDISQTRVMSTIPTSDQLGESTSGGQLQTDELNDRNNPNLLSQLDGNPYHQSITN